MTSTHTHDRLAGDDADRLEAEANQHLLDTTDWGRLEAEADQDLRALGDADWLAFQSDCECNDIVYDIACPKHGF